MIFATILMFEKISEIELKQLDYQKHTDERFDKIFFDGQIYDAQIEKTPLYKNPKKCVTMYFI